MTKTGFSKDETAALKGIAAIMLCFHHTFGATKYFDGFNITFFPLQESFVVELALTCKICVAIFAFISGYGLFLNCTQDLASPPMHKNGFMDVM